ncbi:MAG TPA: DNA replication and repair protein RecF [Xanthomonadales bacterium]|nr:DNA replication and repair protein RecF [Xanthomonadales bacterium]
MVFKKISLQNFRNYTKAEFEFSPSTTIIVGPNAIGKSNLLDAIYLLSTGKSNRTDKDIQLVQFGKEVCRIGGKVSEVLRVSKVSDAPEEETDLEVVFAQSPTGFFQKKYMVNGVSKRRADFQGKMSVVEFSPLDIDIVAGQPGSRRKFLDEVLEQIDIEYRNAHVSYTKAIRQRNALLEQVQKSGIRNEKLFIYWNELVIKNGQIVTAKREEFIEYINNRKKEIFDFTLIYDNSIISEERLLQYKDAEVGAGVTLVGPHRDEVIIKAVSKISKSLEEVKYFGSRGQQRLVSLELKLSQIAIIDEKMENQPLLLLDDVFSELDSSNIDHVLDLMNIYQTIATTTHKEFIGKDSLGQMQMIDLTEQK